MNSDFRLSVEFIDHPKTKKLIKRLGHEAVTCLIRLWTWAARNKPDGNLSGYDYEDIELAADWQGDEGIFVNTLIELHWLDRNGDDYLIHDWAEHNPWASDADRRADEARLNIIRRWNPELAKQLEDKGVTAVTKEQYIELKTTGTIGGYSIPNSPLIGGYIAPNRGLYSTYIAPNRGANTPYPYPNPEQEEDLKTPHSPPKGGDKRKEKKPAKARTPTGNSKPELQASMQKYTSNQALLDSLEKFREMRERIRKPLTGHALKLAFAELDKLAPDNDGLKVKILEQSILHAWQGIFEIKNGNAHKQGRASPEQVIDGLPPEAAGFSVHGQQAMKNIISAFTKPED